VADGFVQVPPDSTGKQVDAASLDVGLNTVMRQRMIIADNSASSQYATVTNGALTVTGNINVSAMPAISIGAGTALIGAVSNAAGTALMGAVSLAAGTANIGFINNISATVVVAGTVSLGAGTANIGTINNISATVVVSGTVSLGAGTANIGTINNISATVVVSGTVSLGPSTNNVGGVSLVAGTANIGFINNISATVIVAGIISLGAGTNLIGAISLAAGTANIGFINNISATVIVAGVVSIGAGTNLMGAVSLAAGTANIGFINNISATVNVACAKVQISAPATIAGGTLVTPWADRFSRAIVQLNHPSLLPTASHGPKCVTLSTSATVALIAAPGAGLSVFISMIAGTNGSATLTRGDVYQTSATASCVAQMYMAASGGGFVMKYDPPIQLLSNSALNARVKPNVSQVIYNVHFYVGPK